MLQPVGIDTAEAEAAEHDSEALETFEADIGHDKVVYIDEALDEPDVEQDEEQDGAQDGVVEAHRRCIDYWDLL